MKAHAAGSRSFALIYQGEGSRARYKTFIFKRSKLTMTPLEYFGYLYLSLRYPALRDYTSGGFGILERYKRNKSYWNTHLRLSQSFIKNALTGIPPGAVAVLGAGRLLDIDVLHLENISKSLTLYDSDPGAESWWKKHYQSRLPRVNYKIQDVTGVMHTWTRSLRTAVTRPKIEFDSLLLELEKILRVSPENKMMRDFSVIISLNLLSQIPVYWEDRCRQILSSRVDCDKDDNYKEFLTRSKRLLEEQHLSQLLASKNTRVIILSDEFFFYYEKDSSEWQVEPALSFSLEARLQELGAPLLYQDRWLWHVAPQGVEFQDHGAIHQISAFGFTSP